ncbi:MAG TPA: multicopper oxidase domain-containing protein [Terriglobales bacterium]|jgi:FtsP/CotA-like multicopper oxidase with cupredoxin domain|nr:multicopper oxidase domain-containing protein [Terriglobales bacterium]
MTVQIFLASLALAQSVSVSLPEPPQVRPKHHVVSLTLDAVIENGRDAFAFDGANVAPVIRASPGDVIKIAYVNDLPAKSLETCAVNPCTDNTNLHFHGLSVSPHAPQDDILTMLAKPGQTLHYAVEIPRDHPPGLFWYHTHPHGESHRQVLDGMSGAIVIEGMERYVPEVARLRERVLVVRGHSTEHDPRAGELKRDVEVAGGCGGEAEKVEEIFTVNGAVRPQIEIAPNERQFWRIVNASADRYLDLQLDGQKFKIVALDGMPLAYRDPKHPTRMADHWLVSPAGRLEAIVTGPPLGTRSVLRSLCVDTGPDGDPNPAMVLADVVPPASRQSNSKERSSPEHAYALDRRPPVYKPLDVDLLKKTTPDFTVTFTEDENGFYINNRKFAMDAPPMTTVHVGSYQHWHIINDTRELHPFHIHQVHFFAYAENGVPLVRPMWLDTVNVPYRGSVDVILDFTDPIIKGMSVFHCHLLNHEDKGMMAKVLFK